MLSRIRTFRSVLIALVLAACDGIDFPDSTLSPVLVPVDSIVLVQNDAAYLASPSALAADDDGYWVADIQQATIVRYDREGRFERALGRKGRGPGEFGAPWRLASGDDQRLLVLDMGDFSVVGVDTRDGTHSFRHALGGMFFGTSMHPRGDSLLLGGLGMTPPLGGVWLNLTTGDVTTAVPAPEVSDPLLSFFEFATAVELRGGVLAVWPALRDSRLRLWDGRDVDVQIPARTRPVPPRDLQDRLMSRQLDPESAWAMIAVPWASTTLAGGDGAIVSLTFTPGAEGEGLRLTGGYLSVISAAADRACVDAPLELRSDERPVVAFRGDTLQLLEQVVQGTDVIAVLRSFVVSTEGCEWMPVEGGADLAASAPV